jgi:hypothetical protein
MAIRAHWQLEFKIKKMAAGVRRELKIRSH